MNQHLRRSVLAALALMAPLTADEVRLKDGRVLVGTVTAQGANLEVTTHDGIVRVAASEVESHRTEAALRQELRALAQQSGDAPFAQLQLAMQARAWGLTPELWRHLGRAAVATDRTAPSALRARLDDFASQLEPELLPRRLRTAKTTARVRELLQRLTGKGDEAEGLRLAIQAILVREPEAEKDLQQQARRNSAPERRTLAIQCLLARNTAGADAFAWRTAILDPAAEVRTASVQVARDAGRVEGAVAYLAPGLMHSSAEVRVRTAEAFANLGEPAAMPLLAAAGPNAGKALAAADDGVRANIAFVEQRSYIRDFDVEVAQASFIADPKVDILQSGTVLDVTIHGVVEEQVRIVRAFRGALQKLGGSDPGPNPAGWALWLAKLQAAAGAKPGPATEAQPTPVTPKKN